MRLLLFVPHNDIEHIQANQRDLNPDANAVRNAHIFDENLLATQEDTRDDEPDE